MRSGLKYLLMTILIVLILSIFWEWIRWSSLSEDVHSVILGVAFLVILLGIYVILWLLQKLRVSRDHLISILNAITEGILELDLQGKHTFVNSSAARMLGYEVEEFMGRSGHSMWHHPNSDVALHLQEKCPILFVLADGQVHRGDNEVFWRKDGTSFPVEYASRPVYRQGKITGVVVTFKDITERKQMEVALHESERRFMDVLYGSQDAILLIDGETFVDCNEATARMLGYPSRGEFLMTHPSQLSPPVQPDGRSSFEKANEMMRIAHEKGSHRFEWEHRKASGEDFPVEVSLTPIRLKGKEVLHCVWLDISSRKKAEETLQWERDRAQQYLDIAGTMFLVLDVEARVVLVNKKGCEILGYDDVDILGKNWFDHFSSKMWREQTEAVFHKLMSGEDDPWLEKDFVNLVLCKGGEEKLVFFHNTVLKNETGLIIGVLSSGEDVTERQRAEVALKDSKEFLARIINAVADPIFVKDREHRWVLFNNAFLDFIGHSSADLLGKSDDEFFPAEQAKVFWAKDEEVFLSGRENINEEFFTDATGVRKVIVTKKALYTDKAGSVFIVGIIRDVTQYKMTEEKLERASAEWRRTFDSITDYVFLMDMDARIVRTNKALFNALGVRPQELLGKKCHEVMHKLGSFCSGCSFREFLKDRRTHTSEVEGLGGRSLSVTVSPVFDDAGQMIGAVHIAKDTSEIKRTELELKRTYEQLSATQAHLVQSEKLASIGQLAAGVAHEINNPVGFVGSNLEVFETYLAGYLKMVTLTEELKGAVVKGSREEADEVIERMREFEEFVNFDYIVQDSGKLLKQSRDGLSRIEKIVSDLKVFAHEDISWLEEAVKIESILEMVLGIAQNELKYRIDLRKEYGETPQLRCNVQRMEQVFLNILMNAAQSIPERGVIGVKTYEKEGYVYVEIQDTGCGIPEENLKKIFDPFFTTKPAGKGTGLGLSISYELVKKQGGDIRVRSTVGQGTIFIIVLPLSSEKV